MADRASEAFRLTREQLRRVDALASERYGIPGAVLMDNAGAGAVDALLAADAGLRARSSSGPAVAVLCGKGNNAGDGFVVGRRLSRHGVATTVVLLMPPHDLAGDALAHYGLLGDAGVTVVDLSAVSVAELPRRLDQSAAGARWLVDALLGSGVQGAPREPLQTAIRWLNAQPARRLALDLPSGLDCDTGATPGAVVRADITCAFVAQKRGFAAANAQPWLGEVRVVPIGTPAELLTEVLGS